MKPDKPFDPNLPFQTRDGRKARLLGIINNQPYPIVAAVTEESGYETVYRTRINGRSVEHCESPNDLINTPRRFKYERWANVYEDGAIYLYATMERANYADTINQGHRIACIPVTIEGEEGRGCEQ